MNLDRRGFVGAGAAASAATVNVGAVQAAIAGSHPPRVAEPLLARDLMQATPAVVSVRAVDRAGAPGRSWAGFFVTSDGHVLTSGRLIGDAERILVGLSDGRELVGERVGSVKSVDLAVIRVPRGDYLALAVERTSRRARVGERLVAIGPASRFGSSASEGEVTHASPGGDLLAIDGPPVSELAGAPVFDSQGRLAGVNAVAFSADGRPQLRFVVPVHMAQSVVRELIGARALA